MSAAIFSLVIDPINPNTIYAGASPDPDGNRNRVFKSTNGGASWNPSDGGLTGSVGALVVDPSNTDTVFAGTYGETHSVFKSINGGASWNRTDTGLPDGAFGAPVIDPNNSNTLYLGVAYSNNGGVYKSTDGGAKWAKVSNLDNAGLLAIDRVNSNTLYVVSAVGYFEDEHLVLFKSTDGGASWTELSLNNPQSLAIDRDNPNTIYGSAYRYTNNSGATFVDCGVKKSTDGGASWSAASKGLPDVSIGPLVIDPVNPDTVYAGTPRGVVFKSVDGGVSWSSMNNGLPDPNVNVLLIDPSGTYLHAGTAGGVFAYQVSSSCDYSISSADQSFEVSGGTGSVDITTSSECSWTAVSYDGWISFKSGNSSGSGNGVVSYSVAANNNSTYPRTGTLVIAGRTLTVTEGALPVAITGASVVGKKLFVYGERFDDGAVILLNGEAQKTANAAENPQTILIGKKAGKKIKPGDILQVRNLNGSMSQELKFTQH